MRPYHVRSIDIGPVVYPFLVRILRAGVANHNQMTAAVLVEQPALDLAAACVDGLRLLDGFLPVQPGPLGRRECDQHGGWDDAAQCAPADCGWQPAVAKMPEGLHQQE